MWLRLERERHRGALPAPPGPARDGAEVSGYDAGRRLEWRCIAELQERGYTCVRSAGSKGRWDVTALLPSHRLVVGAFMPRVLLVQVKRGAWPSPQERKVLAELAGHSVQAQAWRYDKGNTEPTIRVVDGTW